MNSWYTNGPDLDVLPNVRFRIDDAHVRLIGTPIYKRPVIHLQEGIASVVLPTGYIRDNCSSYTIKLTGECCPVVALLAKGMANN